MNRYYYEIRVADSREDYENGEHYVNDVAKRKDAALHAARLLMKEYPDTFAAVQRFVDKDGQPWNDAEYFVRA